MVASSAIALTPVPERPSSFGLLDHLLPSESSGDGWYILVTVPYGEEVSSVADLKRFASAPEIHWKWKSIADRISVDGPGWCQVAGYREDEHLVAHERATAPFEGAYQRARSFQGPMTCYLVEVESPPSPNALWVLPEHRDLDSVEALHEAGYRGQRGADLREMTIYQKAFLEGPVSCGVVRSGWPGEPDASVHYFISRDSGSPVNGAACFFLLPKDGIRRPFPSRSP